MSFLQKSSFSRNWKKRSNLNFFFLIQVSPIIFHNFGIFPYQEINLIKRADFIDNKIIWSKLITKKISFFS